MPLCRSLTKDNAEIMLKNLMSSLVGNVEKKHEDDNILIDRGTDQKQAKALLKSLSVEKMLLYDNVNNEYNDNNSKTETKQKTKAI